MSKTRTSRQHRTRSLLALLALLILHAGCVKQQPRSVDAYMQHQLQEVSYPTVADQSIEIADDLLSDTPATISNYKELDPWELTLEEAIKKSLQNSDVLQKLGGSVVATPQASRTIYDPAIQETDPRTGTEAALSAFDAQLNSSFFLSETNQVFFAAVPGESPIIASQARNFRTELSKQTASGTSFALRNTSTFTDNGGSVLPSTMNTLLQAEVRQPILRGLGVDVNRIAGPNAQPGVYNGVLISRINSDISLADFEAGIRDLVRDVERSYWELYFAYRDLDAKLEARESARKVWVNRKSRLDNGVGRSDEEAQARQQYYNFETQVETALSGQPNGIPGVFGAERQLRRLMGVSGDGTLIRPIDEPAVARVVPDWDSNQRSALERRVELRRQRWIVRQRELELLASRNLNKMRLDFVGQYGYQGIEEVGPNDRDFLGLFSTTNYNENWNVGVELSGPIGRRIYHVASRNAELRLAREKSLLREQQRQVLHGLNEAYTEIDRAFASIKSSYNNLVAAEEELKPKQKRVEAGEEGVFFLLETQQRATIARTSLHRAVVDYNIALLNYSYSAGDLLDRYQISLSEGPWSNQAYSRQNIRLNRLQHREGDYHSSERNPVSKGRFLQQQETYQHVDSEQIQDMTQEPTEAILPADMEIKRSSDADLNVTEVPFLKNEQVNQVDFQTFSPGSLTAPSMLETRYGQHPTTVATSSSDALDAVSTRRNNAKSDDSSQPQPSVVPNPIRGMWRSAELTD